MAEQETKKKDTSQIDNFLTFQKLMGEQLKEKIALDPFMKGAEGALKKMGQKMVEEASIQMSPDNISKQFLSMATGQTTGQQGIQQVQQEKTAEPTNQNFDPVNMLKQLISLGGLIQPSPSDQLALSQSQAIQQKMAGQEPLQQGEKEKLELEKEIGFQQDLQKLSFEYDLKLRNEMMKPDSKANEAIASANIFKNDFMNFVEAFEAIPIKGRGKAAGGAIVAGVSPLFGKEGGREQRAEYETQAEMLAYSMAATKAKQEGRALDREELKRFRNLIKIKTGATEGEKIGKLNAIIKLYNTSAVQSGAEPLADARTILKSVKNKQTLPGTKAVTSKGTSYEIVGD